jgi:hypothetical protein
LLRLALCLKIWSILEKVPWVTEKIVHCSVARWNILQTSFRSTRSMVSFRPWISLLILCLDDLSIGDRRVLKSPTTIMLESICALMSLVYMWWNFVQ